MGKTPSTEPTRDLRQSPEENCKKAYREPELLEWGSVLDLTQGNKAGGEDGDFSGTQPFFAPPNPTNPNPGQTP